MGLYAREFEKDGCALNVRVDGQLTVNDTTLALQAAIEPDAERQFPGMWTLSARLLPVACS